MKRGFTNYFAAFAIVVAGLVAVPHSTFSQGAERSTSPLYTPKYYDPSVGTSDGLPDALKTIGITQRLGESLPLDAEFKDEAGQSVKLGQYFNTGRPIILALVYYECPMLCNQVLNGLVGSLKGMSFNVGQEFDVVAISFDERENNKAGLAQNKKLSYLDHYGRPGTENGWHFLTGNQASIDAVTNATGFRYKWDDKSNQFAHASAIMVITPEGRISRYFYGIDYAPKDLKLSLMESSANKIGTTADQLSLYCYRYDPSTGKYGFAILRVMRVFAVATLAAMAALGFVFWRRSKTKVDI